MKKEIVVFLICLLIAFVLWIVHHLNQTYIRQYSIISKVVQVPSSYEGDSIEIPLKITIKASGIKVLLFENRFPEYIYIPYTQLKKIKKSGKKTVFYISKDNIVNNKSFPVKVKITEISPDTISINFKNKKP
ncbi:MAG: hypothetical protein N2203_08880 [Bacteroidia bacterium]|nr:hypothetical protein [Bacteroidia bacterium]